LHFYLIFDVYFFIIKPMFKNFLLFTFELIKIVVISLVIIIPIRYFLIQPFYVKGASMEPNFYDKEYLIIDEITYRFNEPKRGDIIVFRYPRDPQEFFIKRVIGLPGEEIQIKDGNIIIFNKTNPDGLALKEDYLSSGIKTYGLSDEKITLSDNEFYVLGDNRNASKDSRSFGPVNKSFITGRVLFRGWPFDRVKVFETPSYSF
jgi:signal peptidase I